MRYPDSFVKLVDHLKKLPGVGKKSAERMAYQIIDMDAEFLNNFATSLVEAKSKLGKCKICGCMCEDDLCEICKDETRNKSLICVVQTSKDVYALEKAKDYQGVYHVLNGVISAVNGVSPKDINLYSLIDRVSEGNVSEVIVATNPNIEGESTAQFIAKLLTDIPNVQVTRLAYGLPVGGNLDYADEFTLIKAMQGRRKI
jgi:recombination protein RecR